jgi:hypothetical protein
MTIDPIRLTVLYTTTTNASPPFVMVPSEDPACPTGWRYASVALDTIEVCGNTCGTIGADPGARLMLVMGCVLPPGSQPGSGTVGIGGSGSNPLAAGGTAVGGFPSVSGGTAATSRCPAGEVLCGTSCVNLSDNYLHCGACTNSCNMTANQACVGAVCTCSVGWVDCAGVCRAVQNDIGNCGLCGLACRGGQMCVAGVCTGG